jgi:ribonuclease HII
MTSLKEVDEFSIGVDEAGRGPLAFDVVAAAVIMPPVSNFTDKNDLKIISKIKDSKKMTKNNKTLCEEFIKKHALTLGIGIASPQEIDEVNILQATYLAMHRALDIAYQKKEFKHIYTDGNRFKTYMSPKGDFVTHECVIGGDNLYFNIACASVLAKTHHDEIIQDVIIKNHELEKYGFSTNVGYGTKTHIAAIKEHGPCQYHRTTFLKNIL